MSQERRRYVRLSTERNVMCDIPGIDVVHIVGMGSEGTGMRIITNKELPDGDFPVVLDLADGRPPLNLSGKAVWQENWDFEIFNRVVAGVALQGMNPDDGARIAEVLKEAAAASPTQPDEL